MKKLFFLLLLLLFQSCQLDTSLQKYQVIYAINSSMMAKATQCKQTLYYVTVAAMDNVTVSRLQSCQSLISAMTCPMEQNLPKPCLLVAVGIAIEHNE